MFLFLHRYPDKFAAETAIRCLPLAFFVYLRFRGPAPFFGVRTFLLSININERKNCAIEIG
jgi:hypothetical protein